MVIETSRKDLHRRVSFDFRANQDFGINKKLLMLC